MTYIDISFFAEMWSYILEFSTYVNNLIPTSVNPELKSLYEKLMSWFNVFERLIKPFIRHLRAFGCIAYVYLKRKRRDLKKPGKSAKMALRAVKEHLVRYENLRGHIFKIWISEKNVVMRARDIRFFDENENNNETI
jgi:hypothetical protein